MRKGASSGRLSWPSRPRTRSSLSLASATPRPRPPPLSPGFPLSSDRRPRPPPSSARASRNWRNELFYDMEIDGRKVKNERHLEDFLEISGLNPQGGSGAPCLAARPEDRVHRQRSWRVNDSGAGS